MPHYVKLFTNLFLACLITACVGNNNYTSPPQPVSASGTITTPTVNQTPSPINNLPPVGSQNQQPSENLPATPESSCAESATNFNYQLAQTLYNSGTSGGSWGPMPNTILQEDWVAQCSKNNVFWRQTRTLNAANYWVKQKPDYCHHHVPNWFPPASYQRYLYCANTENNAPMYNIYPGSSTYEQNIRWNYDGVDQTAIYWQNTGQWYGVDCSNYTALVYILQLVHQTAQL